MPIKNKTIKKILSDIKKILQPKKKKMIPGTGESKQTEKYEGQSLMGLEALQEISSLLHQGETLDEMLHAFLDKTLSLLDTDAGAIRLYHFSNGTLRFNVSRGWHSKSEEQFLKTVDGIVDHVYHTGQPYICREYISDPIFSPIKRKQILEGWGGVFLPIQNIAESKGILSISVPLPREITPEELKILTTLSSMVGVAINSFVLHEETARRLQQVQSLHAIDLAINTSLDLNLILDVLLEQVSVHLPVDFGVVFLLHPHLKVLECVAEQGIKSMVKQRPFRLGESAVGKAALERRTILVLNPEKAPDDVCSTLMRKENFVANASVPLISKGEVKGVLSVYSREPFHHDSDWLDFLEILAGQAAIAVDNAQLFENLQKSNLELLVAYDDTIEGWAQFLELRDMETKGHSQRVVKMTLDMAKIMGLKEESLVHIRRGALLHDIGKMGIPDAILQKKGPLTAEEWEIMKKHPQFAYDVLSTIEYLRPALNIPYYHHENWDGTGYPHGLKGEEIPFEARIFAVVDVFDALTSDRPYRSAWTKNKTLQYIHEQKGKKFDPQVATLFLKHKSFKPHEEN